MNPVRYRGITLRSRRGALIRDSAVAILLVRDGAGVARWTHYPKVAGSNPAPANQPVAGQTG